MKDTCRICARELCGNQRRWIFHPGSKLSLQVLLSHALGQELTRDGRGEFACSKCAFMLDRMYRFDTVVARVEVLSLERLHKLLQEKERLRQCIGGLYRRNNPEDGAGGPPDSAPVVDLSALREVRYSDLIQDDLALSVYESWADKEDPEQQVHQCTAADSGLKPRRCRGCAALRVTDSDYEAVCKVPRRMGRRSTSCGPSTRYSTATLGGEDHTRTSAGSEVPPVTFEVRSGMDLRTPSPASSVESLDLPTNHKCQAEPEPEEASGRRDVPWDKPPSEDFLSGLDMILTLLRTSEYRPVKSRRGSKLPVLVKAKLDHFLAPHLSVPPRSPCGGTAHCELYPQQAIPEVLTICPDPVLQEELRDMEEDWLDDYLQVLMDEQQGRLGRYERAAGQCVGELQKAQNRVCSLQAKIRESETRNQLYRVIEEQNKMLSSLRDLQRSGSEAAPGQTEVLALQASLFQAQLELQAGQRAQRQAARAQEVQNRALERLEKDLQGALQHRRETDRHNEYCELLEDPKGTRDSQVLKLRQRITERDRALELQRAVDEKFRSVEQKEEELHGLQLLLRERDRDLDRQRCVLSNNEETIASLEALLRGKVLELDRVSNAWRTVQRQQQDGEDRQNRILREKDAIVGQLQEVLHARTQEAQEELKVRLQLKDRLFQEVLADQTRQAQEHQEQVQDLLRTISCRDQYIQQDSTSRLGEVLAEQASRLQELRRQLSSGSGSQPDSGPELQELQELQEELRLALRREQENRAAQQDLQRQLADPSDLPLVERLTQEVQELREQDVDGPGLTGVQQLLEQKQEVENQLRELKTQLDKSGFSSLSHMQQQSRDLQERLMVSEATVQVQAEQLKDYRDLLETAVQQDSKQVQVDLQDLGYETCGRSENEAERDGTSSPFDDLEMCTSLDCGSQWWPASSSSSTKTTTQSSGSGDEASSLQRLVEDLHSQLSRSQGVIRGLQSRLRSLSTPGTSSAPRKVNWSSPQSGTEEDEGWQSSDGGVSASPRHLHPDKDLQELTSRVDALEDQLRKGGKKTEDGDSATWPRNIDSLIKAQARELSHLRQRLREGRGVCSILTQHLGDTTKAFEELLRANDVDYYMGQSFRDQLAQGSALAQRVSSKISGRELSKELQQKDKVIESLRAKLNLHHHHRPDTPCSSHALSDTTDQSDRISYVSDEHGSTNEDPEFCFDVDGANELGLEETRSSAGLIMPSPCHAVRLPLHPSPPPIAPSPVSAAPVCIAPARRTDLQTCRVQTPLSVPLPPSTRRTQSSRRVGFCLAEVQQELQMLQKQLRGDEFPSPRSRPLSGFPLAHQQPVDPSSFLPPLSFQSFQPSPFSSAASSISLDAGVAMRGGAGLLESSALWEMTYGSRAPRVGADLSTGSSGYQSGTSHTSDLMKEHLREIRSLRQRLEDSIQTNDRLRQQLEDKMTRTASEGPTNIYIQGLDSVSQLSSKIRLLKEENFSLQAQLKLAATGSKEAEHLREAVLLEQSRVKEAELDAERWAGLSRQLQAEAEVQRQEAAQLKQDRLRNQETINLQHEASVLQQQLNESRSLVPELQNELQAPGGSFADRRGCHALGHLQDFKALQQQLLEGSALLLNMEAALGCVRKLLSDSQTLNRILQEAHSLLRRFWRAALPDSDGSLAEEVVSLRLKLSERETALQETTDRLRSSSLSRDSMERLIVSQSRTRDVLQKAKSNLQENSGGFRELTSSPGWSVL
uniref:Myomegalin-like n=1 Tax=Kryptolebias marmoratus TaxID=37003 RepID=A0A3Q3AD35_KRYMA